MCDFSFYLEKGVFVLEAIKKVNKSNGTFVCQNKMNSILFPINFTARDYDVFFTICWYAKQKGYVENRGHIEMPYSEIARFYESNINKTRFNDEIKKFREKVIGEKGTAIYKRMRYDTDNDEITTVGVFFIEIELFRNKQILRFKLNPIALDILFSILQFMKINMYDFVAIRSKFAKTLYRLLIQYDNKRADKDGFKCVKFNRTEFENLMAVPDNYASTDMDSRVIEPAINELDENYFKKLIFEKEFSKNNSRKITGYSFKFLLKEA